MSFQESLKRLRDAAELHPDDPRHRGRGNERLVHQRDLVELLRAHDRLDAEVRLMYPPHIAMLKEAVERLRPALEDVSETLIIMRPAR